MTKKQRKYAILEDSLGYREIADYIKQTTGKKHNYSSVHNHFIESMEKLVVYIAKELGVDISPELANDLARNKSVQSSVQSILEQHLEKTRVRAI